MLQSLAGLDGHGEPEGRPTAEGALHTYGATPLLHDGLGNGQSEARAGFGAIGSIKTIENIGQMFFADAFACIHYTSFPHILAFRLAIHLHRTLAGVLYGIAREFVTLIS